MSAIAPTAATPGSRLLTIQQWADQNGWTYDKARRITSQLPRHLTAEVGNRIYLLEEALTAWLAAGGARAAS